MSRTVKTGGSKPPKTPKATKFEVIKDQGKAPLVITKKYPRLPI